MPKMTHRLFKQSLPRSISLSRWLTIDALLVIAVILLALGLRLYRLGAQSLWLDEGGTWAAVTQHGWLTLLLDLVSPNAAYPLYHLLLKAWIAIAGDSEWALRLPSALAGAVTVGVIMLAAAEQGNYESVTSLSLVRRLLPLIAGLFAACSPYALWHAQDAKVYSLLMLMVALLLWLGLRVCNTASAAQLTWRAIAPLALVAAISLFVHRLALLPIAALLLGLAFIRLRRLFFATPNTEERVLFRSAEFAVPAVAAICGLVVATLGIIGLSRSVSSNGWQESGHSAAGPLLSLWLNIQHFVLDRGDIGGYLGLPLLVWTLPALLLTLWGTLLLLRDVWRGSSHATLVLALFALPMLMFAIVLAFTPLYEARYAVVGFPAWLLVLVRPFGRNEQLGRQGEWKHRKSQKAERKTTFDLRVSQSPGLRVFTWALLISALFVSAAALTQPQHGIFSGAPVKEEWREGVQAITREAHPDDLIIIHPYYTLPLWQYYAPRVTANPMPEPTVFDVFGEGLCVERNQGNPEAIRQCYRRTYDQPFNRFANGKKRALLLIAPDHAATIDPPKSLDDLRRETPPGQELPTKPDQYGWVGLRFLYAQRFWACGTQTFLGIKTMCLSFPETFEAAAGVQTAPPAPTVPLEATFGNEILLRGYSIDLFGGVTRPGGTLPITLYWQSLVNPSKNYSVFLHLCQQCDQPPLASVDEAPLHGYPPAGLTSTWRGYPVHDERSLHLPATLAPGRYTLILGLRPADEDSADQSLRLPITTTQAQVVGSTRLVLGEVVITAE